MSTVKQQDRELILRLLRAAMRQCAAYVETQIAIEAALGFENGVTEVRDYVECLAPEFLDCPEALTAEQVEPLLRLSHKARPKACVLPIPFPIRASDIAPPAC